jgi:hypothetical protein
MSEEATPHMIVMNIRGVVNIQQQDGQWHPAAVINDGFTETIQCSSKDEAIKLLRQLLKELKDKCEKM